jgi:dienelactone hydrolase
MTIAMARQAALRTASAALAVLLAGAGAAAEPLPLPYYSSKPAGDGPFPAVVIMHDCSGLGPASSGAPWRWASTLTSAGYVTVWPDSFTPRGKTKGVCTDASPPRVTPQQRADDAYAALNHLRSLPYVDGRRVAVMGGSHGGRATLAAIVDAPDNAARRESGFAAAVALYPACGQSFGDWVVQRRERGGQPSFSGVFKPLAPLLILIGEADDWTPAEHCRRMAEAARAAGHPVSIKTYPGAHHSFDSPAPLRYVSGRINPNAAGGRGATTGGNAGAWADAVQQVERFFAEHLRK